jgi:hypothetical protein
MTAIHLTPTIDPGTWVQVTDAVHPQDAVRLSTWTGVLGDLSGGERTADVRLSPESARDLANSLLIWADVVQGNKARTDARMAKDMVAIEASAQASRVPTADSATKMSNRIFQWLDLLTSLAPGGYTFTCDEPGKRFVRIVMSVHGQRSVHAFYDKRTGDVYKAAGWKAPAKHVRFNLLDDASFDRMLSKCDWPGHYLYIR